MGNDVSMPPINECYQRPSTSVALSQVISELNYMGNKNIDSSQFQYLKKFYDYITYNRIEESYFSHPIGSIIPYYGTIAPPQWLLCNGERFNTLLYSTLYELLGDDKLPHIITKNVKFIIRVSDELCHNN